MNDVWLKELAEEQTPSVQAVNQLLVTMGYRLDIVPICDSEYEEMEEMQNEKKTDL